MNAFCLISGLALALGTSAQADQLDVVQGKLRTSGAVIWSGPEGTYILTCRHYRDVNQNWTAREGSHTLQGTHTLLSSTDDLALLWVRGRWGGTVHTLAAKGPDLPVVFLTDDTLLPRQWPLGYPLYLVPESMKLGQSGMPLLRDGKLCGVCWGQCDGKSAYVRHDTIVRFLKEANWSNPALVATRKPLPVRTVSQKR